MLVIIVLFVLVIIAVITTKSDPRVEKLKEKYTRFIQILPEKFSKLKRRSIITGTYSKGQIGENINKGGEIIVCVDGEDENDMFHILLHELAHSTVSEYDHSSKFWDNYKELMDIAVREGFYKPGVNKQYCGKMINDSP